MKIKTLTGLATALMLTAVGQSTYAAPLECGMPLDVYLATGDPVPEGIAYEYITDEEGNFILVGEENFAIPVGEENFAAPLECGMPLDVYLSTGDPVPEGIAYEYITDEEGNFILVGEENFAIPVGEESFFLGKEDFPNACDPEILFQTTCTPVPEGTAYEYIQDAEGNYILVDDQGNPIPVDEGFSMPMMGQAQTSAGVTMEITSPFRPSMAERLFQSLFGLFSFS